METRYLFSDILEMLKLIKDDKSKQNTVEKFLKNITKPENVNDIKSGLGYESIIPKHIMEMLASIRYDQKKLLKVLTFIEDEILKKKEDKDECENIDEFKTIIPQIMEALEGGYIVYLNPETLEMEQVENKTVAFIDEFEELNDDKMDEFELEYVKWDNYIKFEPLDYQDTATITEDFVRQLDDVRLATELEDALTIEESMDEFCNIIERSPKVNQEWQNFKRKATEDYIKNQLIGQLKGFQHEGTTELILDENL